MIRGWTVQLHSVNLTHFALKFIKTKTMNSAFIVKCEGWTVRLHNVHPTHFRLKVIVIHTHINKGKMGKTLWTCKVFFPHGLDYM